MSFLAAQSFEGQAVRHLAVTQKARDLREAGRRRHRT